MLTGAEGPDGGRHIQQYDVYGVKMATAYAFAGPAPPAAGTPDLMFNCSDQAPLDVDWGAGELVDAQGPRPDGRSDFVFHRFLSHDAVRITDATDFHVFDDRILCHLLHDRHRYLVEIALLGMVMALWLERRGVPTLHASAVTIGDRAVGFLATRGGGKTSTAAACTAAGHPLLTDDLLALGEEATGLTGKRGWPALRLWPDQGHHFVKDYEHAPLVHPDYDKRRVPVGTGFGTFAAAPAPLARLYVPERHPDASTPVTVTPLTPQEALVTLIRHSFLPREVQRYGLQPQRLRTLGRLVAEVPISVLRFPTGFDRLSQVVGAIEADVASG